MTKTKIGFYYTMTTAGELRRSAPHSNKERGNIIASGSPIDVWCGVPV